MKVEYSLKIFEKYSNLKFHEIRSMVAELFHADGGTGRQTDRRDEANSRVSKFCERA
jgi:hypothetical protein